MPEQETLVKTHFELSAEAWRKIYAAQDLDSLIIQQRRHYVLEWVGQLDLKPGARVLDLGCGAGLTALALARSGMHVEGVDVAEAMLDQGREALEKAGTLPGSATFSIGNAEALDFPDEHFDLVIAMGLLEYLRFPRWALQEMGRVLKSGAPMIVTVPNADRLAYKTRPQLIKQKIKQKLREKFFPVKEAGPGDQVDAAAGFKRTLYHRVKIERLLEAASLEPVRLLSHGFGPLWPFDSDSRASVVLDRFIARYALKEDARPLIRDGGANIVALARKPVAPSTWQAHPYLADPEAILGPFMSERAAIFDAIPAKDPALEVFSPEEAITGPVLVLSPHPDDEVIGCGGALLRLRDKGVPLTILQMTDGREAAALRGEPEETLANVRFQEAEQVAEALKARLIVWPVHGNTLEPSPEWVARLVALLKEIQPSAVFCPDGGDPHPDHAAAAQLLDQALKEQELGFARPDVYHYEVWSLVAANRHHAIHDQLEEKNALLRRYRTGMKAVDYVRFCESLALYHAWRDLEQRDFVEVFHYQAGE